MKGGIKVFSLVRRNQLEVVAEEENRQQEKRKTARKARQMLRTCFLMCLMAVFMALSVFAEGETGASDMSAVLNAATTVTSLMASAWTLLTSNPYLVVFLAISLFSAIFGLIRRAKRAATR